MSGASGSIDSGCWETTMATAAKRYGRRRKERSRGTRQERGYDQQWLDLRKMYFAQHPVCEHCGRPAEDVDHIEPFKGLNDPKRTEWSNLQSLCRQCHNIKTVNGIGGRISESN